MTNDRSEKFRHQELADFYEALRQESIQLFAERWDALMNAYGETLFDTPECAAIINVPADRQGVTPTRYMAYLEARFVLGCDPSENDELMRLWAHLYEHAKAGMGVDAASMLAARNTLARHAIMDCQRQVNTTFAVMTKLLDAGRRQRANRAASRTLKHVRRTFRGIAASYTQLTLQSH